MPDYNQRVREGRERYFRQFGDWLRKVAYLSNFVLNLVDLVVVEETEILPDMSVNFKDFAIETRFVLQFVRRHVRHFPQGPQVDRRFVV